MLVHMVSLLLLAAVVIRVTDGPVNTFDPREALGAGVDGHEQGEVEKMLSPANVKAMLSAGLKPLSYRLRTELAGEAWHWNPEGQWSDAVRRQGYWISNRESSKPIRLSYGYKLPRRGNSADQANNDGYSRLDDGDPATFWKSNPYLDRHYTGEDNSGHPAWVVIDFGKPRQIDTLRVLWGEPFATRFSVEYSDAADIEVNRRDVWKACPGGESIAGEGGNQAIHLRAPVTTRYLRILMPAFSGTAPAGSKDIRDRLGVAIREIYAERRGVELIRHSADHRQTVMYVSSTDPWHRAVDRDQNIEQPGFDLLYGSGLTNGLPVLMAVPILYDVPENAAAQIAYLKQRGYAVTHAELSEEPEEQQVMPEDYGALYLQWSRALHGVDAGLKIGGPSVVLPSAQESWVDRMWTWFASKNRSSELAFLSFEWYPFDEVCEPAAPQLAISHEPLPPVMKQLRNYGAPLYMTEYGYSAYGSRAEVDIEGALLNAEIVGQFFTLGGARAYLYGYEPNELINEKGCSWGNNMLFGLGDEGGIEYRTAAYWAARLVAEEWAQSSGGTHKIYGIDSDTPLLQAFAVERPDGQMAVMLIHKNPRHPATVQIPQFTGSVDIFEYSREQYQWRSTGSSGHPVRDLPPRHRVVNAADTLELPPYSLTIVRGRLH